MFFPSCFTRASQHDFYDQCQKNEPVAAIIITVIITMIESCAPVWGRDHNQKLVGSSQAAKRKGGNSVVLFYNNHYFKL